MPPEYIDEFAISKKFDVYSLGDIIIRIMDGKNGHSHFSEMGAEKFIQNVRNKYIMDIYHFAIALCVIFVSDSPNLYLPIS